MLLELQHAFHRLWLIQLRTLIIEARYSFIVSLRIARVSTTLILTDHMHISIPLFVAQLHTVSHFFHKSVLKVVDEIFIGFFVVNFVL